MGLAYGPSSILGGVGNAALKNHEHKNIQK